jgi:hypothetical protein
MTDLREMLDALDSALDAVCGAADELRATLPEGSVLVTHETLAAALHRVGKCLDVEGVSSRPSSSAPNRQDRNGSPQCVAWSSVPFEITRLENPSEPVRANRPFGTRSDSRAAR